MIVIVVVARTADAIEGCSISITGSTIAAVGTRMIAVV